MKDQMYTLTESTTISSQVSNFFPFFSATTDWVSKYFNLSHQLFWQLLSQQLLSILTESATIKTQVSDSSLNQKLSWLSQQLFPPKSANSPDRPFEMSDFSISHARSTALLCACFSSRCRSSCGSAPYRMDTIASALCRRNSLPSVAVSWVVMLNIPGEKR